jgi:NADPH2:quinone reductase
LIKNQFAGVNFIDIYHRTGLYPQPMPFIPGREGSGRVEAVGADVKHVNVGDNVCYFSAGSYSEYIVAEGRTSRQD